MTPDLDPSVVQVEHEQKNDSNAGLAEVDDDTTVVPADAASHAAPTPGPWTVETQWASDVDDNQFPFAHWIAGPEGEQIAEQILEKPDAHLIAAAPDLLEALKAWIEYETVPYCDLPTDRRDVEVRDLIAQSKAALSKAEGRGGRS